MKGATQLTRKIIGTAYILNTLLAQAANLGLKVEIKVENRELPQTQKDHAFLNIDVFQNLSEAEKKKLIITQMSLPLADTLPNFEADIGGLGDKGEG